MFSSCIVSNIITHPDVFGDAFGYNITVKKLNNIVKMSDVSS